MPTTEEYKKVVIRQICQQKELQPDEVALDVRLVEDLGFDSLDVFELVAELEEAFDVPIPDAVLTDVRTVQDAIDVVDRMVKQSAQRTAGASAASPGESVPADEGGAALGPTPVGDPPGSESAT